MSFQIILSSFLAFSSFSLSFFWHGMIFDGHSLLLLIIPFFCLSFPRHSLIIFVCRVNSLTHQLHSSFIDHHSQNHSFHNISDRHRHTLASCVHSPNLFSLHLEKLPNFKMWVKKMRTVYRFCAVRKK